MTPRLQPSPEGDRGGAGAVVIGVLLALMTALTAEVLFLFAGAAVAALTGWERGTSMTVAVGLASCVAWGIAGAVAYEAARRRTATIAAALLPAAIVAVLLFAALVVQRQPLTRGSLAAVASAGLLGAAAWLGGRLRERRIRRRVTLQ